MKSRIFNSRTAWLHKELLKKSHLQLTEFLKVQKIESLTHRGCHGDVMRELFSLGRCQFRGFGYRALLRKSRIFNSRGLSWPCDARITRLLSFFGPDSKAASHFLDVKMTRFWSFFGPDSKAASHFLGVKMTRFWSNFSAKIRARKIYHRYSL